MHVRLTGWEGELIIDLLVGSAIINLGAGDPALWER